LKADVRSKMGWGKKRSEIDSFKGTTTQRGDERDPVTDLCEIGQELGKIQENRFKRGGWEVLFIGKKGVNKRPKGGNKRKMGPEFEKGKASPTVVRKKEDGFFSRGQGNGSETKNEVKKCSSQR